MGSTTCTYASVHVRLLRTESVNGSSVVFGMHGDAADSECGSSSEWAPKYVPKKEKQCQYAMRRNRNDMPVGLQHEPRLLIQCNNFVDKRKHVRP